MTPVIVFFDSDVLIAGSASKTGASFILLQLSELGFIHIIACKKVYAECRRNLGNKLPQALKSFDNIISHSIKLVPDPNNQECIEFTQMAHEKDLPILVSAIKNNAKYLVTFNIKHYYPESMIDIQIVKPKVLLHSIRNLLSEL